MVMFKAGACPLLRSQSSQDSSDAPDRRVAEGPAAWPRYACAPFPFPIPLPSRHLLPAQHHSRLPCSFLGTGRSLPLGHDPLLWNILEY